MNYRSIPLLVLLVGASLTFVRPVCAQGTLADYERSDRFPGLTRNTVFRASVKPHWLEGSGRFWYRNDNADGSKEYIFVDSEKGIRRKAFDHEKLAQALAKIQPGVQATKLDVEPTWFAIDGSAFEFRSKGKSHRCVVTDYSLIPAKERKGSAIDESIPALLFPRPTRRNGESTALTFVNERKQAIELFWVSSDGGQSSYGKIAPGASSTMQTYAGHVWLVMADGKTWAAFETPDDGGRIVVSEGLYAGKRQTPLGFGKKGPAPATPRNDRPVSPDGKWRAFFKNHNLFLQADAGGDPVTLTKDGTENDSYEGPTLWSADSTRLVVTKRTRGAPGKAYLVESSPKDAKHPRLHTITYARPGDKLDVAVPCLFNVPEKKRIAIDDKLFSTPWSITRGRWDKDGKEFCFLFNQRGHQALRLLAVNGADGKVRAIIDETSKTFVDYSGKFFLHEVADESELIWMSERDGWNHLYLIDRKSGAVKNPITKGEWVVRGVDRVDEEKRQIYFRAGGMTPGEDPYHVHFCRINFDGTGLVRLTAGDGNHAITYSPDGKYLVDSYSRVDSPPVTEIRRSADGSLACSLEKADIAPLLKTGWKLPERFVAKGRDGKTDIHGVIYRPTTFDAKKKYPIIEYIYAGPHSAFVPKTFRPYVGPQALAELGFIVVQIDGMGTSHRSKAFHDVCWKNLGDSGFPDRILWIKAAAEKYGYMDIRRVGIYGGSAGGQSALRALLAFGDFYTVAVADCGCHDNRIDKIWWNELWMGFPIGPHYAAQSNATNAHKLRGRLLLTVGELDKNVDPASTMQVVDALVKARKDFDLLVIPGAGHGAGESPYGARRRKDFFVRHLLGVTPPDWNARPVARKSDVTGEE